jgi:hypothetical protein
MTQPKDFSPIRPSVWGLTTTWPLLQRLCEEDPQARGLLDVVVTWRIIPHGIVKLTQIIVRLCSKERTIKGLGLSRTPGFSLFPPPRLFSRGRRLGAIFH